MTATRTTQMTEMTWTAVCAVDAIPLEGGVAALVDGQAVAVFRTHDGSVHALGNIDPFSQTSVLSRGIVGSRGDAPVVSSPMYKQAFDLRTGRCLDDDSAGVPAYDVAVVDGRVLVGAPREAT
ncbi:nitrite reductase small subunit [Nocardioides sp. Root122]|uniref:nitrite reductase small subunit NirD n=1 Tax=Nocardioides TaxID=1839 RepID=UPI0007030E7C|nr:MULTISPECIES: nitrite reductase small subunit NirD [Nocardioides]KQV63377.1 nitrite reductase small subunit [Nocardioides sp. Root122]MCK9825521.1 nitrite reductase small subunit NirD [Nocardioides cavernae]